MRTNINKRTIIEYLISANCRQPLKCKTPFRNINFKCAHQFFDKLTLVDTNG